MVRQRTFAAILLLGWWLCPLDLLHAESNVGTDDPSGLVTWEEVDLALVLAADVSSSMDAGELRLQRDGYVAAFRDPDVIEALLSGHCGRIAVTYLEWAGANDQAVVAPWAILDSYKSANEFAVKLSSAGMFAGGGGHRSQTLCASPPRSLRQAACTRRSEPSTFLEMDQTMTGRRLNWCGAKLSGKE